jgi:hypothetical protein
MEFPVQRREARYHLGEVPRAAPLAIATVPAGNVMGGLLAARGNTLPAPPR